MRTYPKDDNRHAGLAYSLVCFNASKKFSDKIRKEFGLEKRDKLIINRGKLTEIWDLCLIKIKHKPFFFSEYFCFQLKIHLINTHLRWCKIRTGAIEKNMHMFIYRLILSTSISGRQIALFEQSNILRIFKNGHILTPESFILGLF